MDRRKFIKNSSLIGVLSIIPTLFLREDTFKRFSINPIRSQIRHGLLNDDFQEITPNLHIQRNLFLQNGLSKSNNDITNINIKFAKDEKVHSLFLNKEGLRFENTSKIQHQKLREKEKLEFSQGYILPLKGTLTINNHKIGFDEIIKIDSTTTIVSSDKSTEFIVIS